MPFGNRSISSDNSPDTYFFSFYKVFFHLLLIRWRRNGELLYDNSTLQLSCMHGQAMLLYTQLRCWKVVFKIYTFQTDVWGWVVWTGLRLCSFAFDNDSYINFLVEFEWIQLLVGVISVCLDWLIFLNNVERLFLTLKLFSGQGHLGISRKERTFSILR